MTIVITVSLVGHLVTKVIKGTVTYIKHFPALALAFDDGRRVEVEVTQVVRMRQRRVV